MPIRGRRKTGMRRLTSDAGSNEIDGGVDGWDISRSFEKVGALGDLVGLGVGAGVGRGSQTQIWTGCDHHPAIARIFSHPRGASLSGLEHVLRAANHRQRLLRG